MKLIILILWFLILNKILLFWLWLWQLKEYHFGRLRAHFERGRIKKFLAALFYFRLPKPTLKIVLVFLTGFLFEIILFFNAFFLKGFDFYFRLFVSLFFAPIIFSIFVLIFQIPSFFWRKFILLKARRKMERYKDLLVIGITGSYGKTSTKEFLAQILSEKFKVLKTPLHINAEIGIAKFILKELNKDCEVFIAEIGAYEKGKIKQVCEVIKPKIGILTGINEQHLSTFGSLENIIEAKFELIESLPQSGLAVLNGNNQIIKNSRLCQGFGGQVKLKIKNDPEQIPKEFYGASNPKLKIKLSSTEEKLDLWAEDIRMAKEWICFRVFSKDGDLADFRINLIGLQNVENILLAALTAKELGMTLQEIARVCQQIEPMRGAMKLVKKQGFNVLDATYSSNPSAIFPHLDYLKLWEGKRAIVTPCLIELGKRGAEIHSQIGEKIGEVCNLAVITTSDYFKEIKSGFKKKGGGEIFLIKDAEEIFEKIKNFNDAEDIVLLESRVPLPLVKKLLGNDYQRN